MSFPAGVVFSDLDFAESSLPAFRDLHLDLIEGRPTGPIDATAGPWDVCGEALLDRVLRLAEVRAPDAEFPDLVLPKAGPDGPFRRWGLRPGSSSPREWTSRGSSGAWDSSHGFSTLPRSIDEWMSKLQRRIGSLPSGLTAPELEQFVDLFKTLCLSLAAGALGRSDPIARIDRLAGMDICPRTGELTVFVMTKGETVRSRLHRGSASRRAPKAGPAVAFGDDRSALAAILADDELAARCGLTALVELRDCLLARRLPLRTKYGVVSGTGVAWVQQRERSAVPLHEPTTKTVRRSNPGTPGVNFDGLEGVLAVVRIPFCPRPAPSG